jgi:hypothetical protein
MGTAVCCPAPAADQRDGAPMLDPAAKIALPELAPATPAPPLLDGVQAAFKAAADADSSASPIEQGLIDELGSSGSDDRPPKT